MNGSDGHIDRIYADYFSDPSRHMDVAAGTVLMDQDHPNDRLYYVLAGSFAGTIVAEDELGEERQLELFRSEPGDFLGIMSFFSSTNPATRVVALTDGKVAWMDRSARPVDEQNRGSLRKQFLPVIMEELADRQVKFSRAALEREAAVRRLHIAENLSTLGQLSAGLAHELNNAIGILGSASEHLTRTMGSLLARCEPAALSWFTRGNEAGQTVSSLTVRKRARELTKKGISYDQAKILARVFGDEPLPDLPADLDQCLAMWEAGRECHDMQVAARHAAAIVRSVKQLGGGSRDRADGVSVNQSLREALSLLKSNLREVTVDIDLDERDPTIWGNSTELVQIWLNIIKNGWDALKQAAVPEGRIVIRTRSHRRAVEISIANNGPRIPETLRQKLFQPHITTKRGSEHMGLGLGLYIVKRLVDSYCGELAVLSTEQETRFTIMLPIAEVGQAACETIDLGR